MQFFLNSELYPKMNLQLLSRDNFFGNICLYSIAIIIFIPWMHCMPFTLNMYYCHKSLQLKRLNIGKRHLKRIQNQSQNSFSTCTDSQFINENQSQTQNTLGTTTVPNLHRDPPGSYMG